MRYQSARVLFLQYLLRHHPRVVDVLRDERRIGAFVTECVQLVRLAQADEDGRAPWDASD